MTDAEITPEVVEAFLHFYYESMVTDISRLQQVLDPACKFVYRTCKQQSKETHYDTKKDTQTIVNTLQIVYKGIKSVEILMWTPITLDDSAALVVSAQYNTEAGGPPLLSSDVLILGKSKQKQKRGFTVTGITTHVLRPAPAAEIKSLAK